MAQDPLISGDTWGETRDKINANNTDQFRDSFENADLVAGVMTFDHGLARMPISLIVTTPSGEVVSVDTVITTTQIILTFGGTIPAGSWTVGAF